MLSCREFQRFELLSVHGDDDPTELPDAASPRPHHQRQPYLSANPAMTN